MTKKMAILKCTAASSNTSPEVIKHISIKSNNFVIVFQILNLVLKTTILMAKCGYPYNDLVICKDSPDYLHY